MQNPWSIGVALAACCVSSQAGALLEADAELQQTCLIDTAKPHINGPSRRPPVIVDPATGMRWRVKKNGNHPGWPAELIGTSHAVSTDEDADRREARISEQSLIVRAGDSLLVLEETNTLQARFKAVALSSGATGDFIDARLRFAGKVVRVQLTGRGKALLIKAGGEVLRCH